MSQHKNATARLAQCWFNLYVSKYIISTCLHTNSITIWDPAWRMTDQFCMDVDTRTRGCFQLVITLRDTFLCVFISDPFFFDFSFLIFFYLCPMTTPPFSNFKSFRASQWIGTGGPGYHSMTAPSPGYSGPA